MVQRGKIQFELFAPHNPTVALLGSWDDWQAHPMERGDDGTWRTALDIPDGEYEYKFRLVSKSFFAMDQDVEVSDPTAIELGRTTRANAFLRVKNGARVLVDYEWQHDDVPLPSNDKLIIYELHLGDFRGGEGDDQTEPGTFRSAMGKLDYLADLGINAIELMPVSEIPGANYWGYSQRSIYAVENRYGTPEDFCAFVDACHARGIRVIYDAVYNHMATDSPLTMIDHNYWFYGENPDEASLQFGPKFNYEFFDPEYDVWPARQHVVNAMELWIELFHLDGIRFDATRAIKYFDLLQWFTQEAHERASFKPFITIAEHLPQDPSIAGAGRPMDAAWHDDFYRQAFAATLGVNRDGRDPFNTGELMRVMDGRRTGFQSPYNTIQYINNHDQERVMYLLGVAAGLSGEAAFRRNKLGASLLLTAPGIPMLWAGEEFGQPTPKSEERQPLVWGLLGFADNQNLHAHYRNLVNIRKANPALTGENYSVLLDQPAQGLAVYKRWNDAGNEIIVAASLKNDGGGDLALEGITDGTWRESVYGYDVTVRGGVLRDTLRGAEAKIYIKQL